MQFGFASTFSVVAMNTNKANEHVGRMVVYWKFLFAFRTAGYSVFSFSFRQMITQSVKHNNLLGMVVFYFIIWYNIYVMLIVVPFLYLFVITIN